MALVRIGVRARPKVRAVAKRTTVNIGRIGIWTGVLDGHPTSVAQDAARQIEAMGYGALWIPEAVGRDPMVSAANLLNATSTLAVATGIANIYARDPMTMVSGQRTLAEAYQNRFLLGMGVSHWHLVEHLRKHSYDKPLSYMRAYLAAMEKSLFMAVGPDEDPGCVLAALGPKMLELAATETAVSDAFGRLAAARVMILHPGTTELLSFNPTALFFTGGLGQTQQKNFTVSNGGNLAAAYTLAIGGSNPGAFSVNPTSSSVSPGFGVTETVTFTGELLSPKRTANVSLSTSVARCAPIPAPVQLTGN